MAVTREHAEAAAKCSCTNQGKAVKDSSSNTMEGTKLSNDETPTDCSNFSVADKSALSPHSKEEKASQVKFVDEKEDDMVNDDVIISISNRCKIFSPTPVDKNAKIESAHVKPTTITPPSSVITTPHSRPAVSRPGISPVHVSKFTDLEKNDIPIVLSIISANTSQNMTPSPLSHFKSTPSKCLLPSFVEASSPKKVIAPLKQVIMGAQEINSDPEKVELSSQNQQQIASTFPTYIERQTNHFKVLFGILTKASIPIMGFCLYVGNWMSILTNRITALELYGMAHAGGLSKDWIKKHAKQVSLLAFCVYAVLLSTKTIHRYDEWHTEAKLFESALYAFTRPVQVLNNYAQKFNTSEPTHAIAHIGTKIDAFKLKLQLSLSNEQPPFSSLSADKAIPIDDSYFLAHLNEGIRLESAGDTLAAIESFNKSLELHPHDNRVKLMLANSMLSHAKKEGNTESAKSYMRQALSYIDDYIDNGDGRKNPRALHFRCELGDNLGYPSDVNTGFCLSAIEANRDLKSKNGSDVGMAEDLTFNILGLISRKNGFIDEAVEYFLEGLEVNQHSFDILVNLAAVYGDTKQFELAGVYYKRAEALDVSPDLKAFLFANKGWMMEIMGLQLAARQYYINAINITHPNTHHQIILNFRNIEKYCQAHHCQ